MSQTHTAMPGLEAGSSHSDKRRTGAALLARYLATNESLLLLKQRLRKEKRQAKRGEIIKKKRKKGVAINKE